MAESNDDFFKALSREIRKRPTEPPVGEIGGSDSVVNSDGFTQAELDEGLDQFVTENSQEIWVPALPTEMPPIRDEVVAGPISLSNQQKNNICIISYSLATRNLSVDPEAIYHLWPIEGDVYKLARAGKRPSITGIQQYIATDEFSERMGERGIDIKPITGLMPEQIALISILSDTNSKLSFNARLRKAGISWAKYNGWRRQKPFADALQEAQGGALKDAIGNADVQLAQMAQNGDLNSIKYLNEMIGRGPNDRKAVDAMQFARIVLEAVQKHVDPNQARAISAEIELASKQLGIGG